MDNTTPQPNQGVRANDAPSADPVAAGSMAEAVAALSAQVADMQAQLDALTKSIAGNKPRRMLRFIDLKERRIAKSWSQVSRLVQKQGMPAGVMISEGVRAWAEDEIEQWLASLPAASKRMRHSRPGEKRFSIDANPPRDIPEAERRCATDVIAAGLFESHSRLYRAIRRGEFPQATRFDKRRFWSVHDIEAAQGRNGTA